MLLFIRLLNLASSAILAQYRFGKGFGQVLKDFTANEHHCVNGESWTTSTNDALITDRGAYFSGMTEQITFPPNDRVLTSFSIPSTYSIAIWLSPDCTSCSIFSRTKDLNSYFYYAFKPTNNLVAYYRFGSINTGQKSSGDNVYTLRKWMLITIGHSIFTCTISVDGTIEISINTGISTYGESGSYNMYLGKAAYSFPTFSGFIWSFRLDDSLNIQTTYYVGSSSNCLTGSGCSGTCSPAVKDSYTGNGCISSEFDISLTASGASCPSSCPLGPCTNSICLTCACIFGSCIITGGQNLCDCPSGTTATSSTCLCTSSNYYNGNGCVACESSCLTCQESNACLTCIANNAVPDSIGCKCVDGFWGAKPLTIINACNQCLADCSSCDSSATCLTCISQFSHPVTGGCLCDDGYWGNSSLSLSTSCQMCHSHCLTCSEASKCLVCKDSNASPDSVSGCSCNNQFFLNSDLSVNGACVPCHSHCETCSAALICSTCKDLNANTSLIEGCGCKDFFYLSGDLSLSGSCSPCHSHCLTCTDSFVCTQCIALNAYPDIIGCICSEGFYPIFSLSDPNACGNCHLSCKTCSDNLTCLTCKSSNTEIGLSYCECKAGYFASKSLNNIDACVICYEDCLTCINPLLCLTCKDPNSNPSTLLGCECNVGYYKNTNLPNGSQCSLCFEECAECESFEKCSNCKAINSYFNQTNCLCNQGYYQDGSIINTSACIQCNKKCKTCSGPTFYHCTACEGYLLNTICTDICPVGFYGYNHKCVQERKNKPAVKFVFKSIHKFIDSVNGLSAVPANENRNLIETPPIGAYLRGVYFQGTSFLRISETNSRPLLSPQFTFSFWINPELETCGVFYRSTEVYHIKIFIEQLYLFIQIKIDFEVIQYKSLVQIHLFYWNQFTIGVYYNEGTLVSMIVNDNVFDTVSYMDQPFVDEFSEDCYLGFGDQIDYYQGFIYEFSIYIDPLTNDKVVSSSCVGCDICPVNLKCIPNCRINQFFDENFNDCQPCNINCETGCVRGQNCILCLNPHCINCSNYYIGLCTQCTYNFELIDGNCEQCKEDTFYDLSSSKCIKCSGLCLTCSSKDHCLTCKTNSSLSEPLKCKCNLGYSGDQECKRTTFKAALSILTNNTIKVSFSEDLTNLFNSKDLIIYLSGKRISFSLALDSDSSIILTLSLNSTIPRDSKLVLKFSNQVNSINNSLLSPNIYTIVLFPSDSEYKEKILKAEIKNARKLAYNGASIGLGITAGCSVLLWDPTSFFNFVNTAEIYYSSYLIQNNLHPVLEGFLLGMRVQSDIPNVYKYFIESKKGVVLPIKYIKYGFDTNLALLNIGPYYTMLAWLISTCLIVRIIRCKFKEKTEKIWKKYKFGVFLRFWVQSNLELYTAVALSLKYSNLGNSQQIADFVIGIILLVSFT